MQKPFKQIGKHDFSDFLDNYDGSLARDICRICDPPVITYNDFKLGKFPKSIVAREETPYLLDGESEYFIRILN